MTKVTIDDIEYDTSDFSEDQNNWVMELQYTPMSNNNLTINSVQ